MAETVRFELTVPIKVRTLSKGVVSATHPRLHKPKSSPKYMAEDEGFEPPDGANRRQFSKLLPSTTRPVLQANKTLNEGRALGNHFYLRNEFLNATHV